MKFVKEYFIYDFLCNRGYLSYKNLVNILLETSNEQSIINNSTAEDLLKVNKTWMIYKWKISLNRPIKRREKILVRTWASGFEKISAYREFEIIDENKEVILKASAIFLVVDLIKLKPVRISDEISGEYEIINERNFETIERIKPDLENLLENKFKIRKSDIDINGHVNNVIYIDWIEETLSEEIYANYFISELNLIYSREIRNSEYVNINYNHSYSYFEIKTDTLNARAKINIQKKA